MRRAISLLVATGLLAAVMVVPAGAQSQTIADIVVAASSTDGPDNNPKDYDLLLAAVLADDAAGGPLLDALSGSDQLTVFAPRDSAFLKLLGVDTEAEAAQALSDAELLGSKALRDVVLYHVVPGRNNVKNTLFEKYRQVKEITTLQGSDIGVQFTRVLDETGQRVVVNLRNSDIKADNGIIHTIKRVILFDGALS